jgi:N-acetylmuramoyl-L-alanine amidase
MKKILALLTALWLAGPALAEGLVALARVEPARTSLAAVGPELRLSIGLSQGVPYRIFTLADPWRLVVDFSEVDWTALDPARLTASRRIVAARTGRLGPGWSRLVLELRAPMALRQAEMATDPEAGAVLKLVLAATDAARFRAAAGAPAAARFTLPEGVSEPVEPKRRQTGAGNLVVVLDPGHGGVDPGADHGGVVEAPLMLSFALDLEEALLRAGGFEVILTRRDDSFVPLEARVSIARAAGADVFLSLHADAVAEGRASGATIYTLSDTASDAASQKLAERHDREDLLAGVDLTHQDDVIAGLLMDLARTETRPRSDRLADALVGGLKAAVGGLHKRPRLEASFSVLKAPDIPSVLIELGFLSSERDRARLVDPVWREKAVAGIVGALQAWASADAAEALLIRK